MQVTYYAHTELKEDVSKWNTSAYGYRQSMDIDPMGNAYLHLTDSQCANNDGSNNFNIPALDWMGSENDVIILSCLIFLLIRHPNMVAQTLRNSILRNQFSSKMYSIKILIQPRTNG